MKKLFSLLLALSLLLSLAACAASPASTAPQPSEVSSESTAAAPEPELTYPMTFTDQAGRQVTLASEPQRIISSYYITTSSLVALGLSDRIVGVENNPGKRPIYSLSAPELLEKSSVGTAKELDLEACLALDPDLVILPMRLKAAAENLEQLDIPVMLVNPESRELLLDMIARIGRAANAEDRANTLQSFITGQQEQLNRLSGNAPLVYLAGNSSLLSTAGGSMYQSDLIALAGGQNVAAELTDTYWSEISYEQLLAWDPEYIVLASDAVYTAEDVLSDPNLASTRAVLEGKVVRLPNHVESWDSPVPACILGSVWLASILHPEEISMEEANEIISEFYSQFYGFTYTAE